MCSPLQVIVELATAVKELLENSLVRPRVPSPYPSQPTTAVAHGSPHALCGVCRHVHAVAGQRQHGEVDSCA